MADNPDEGAAQSQVHGCGSYPLSFPSQPPDIKNWFSSYEYESPEGPELAADPDCDSGTETQDPLELGVPGNSLLKHAHPDGCTTLRGIPCQVQLEHEGSAMTALVPVGRSTVERGAKRKQSLRSLFGDGFIDDRCEATETESQVVLSLQRNAVEPQLDSNGIGLPDAEGGQEGAIEHCKLSLQRNAVEPLLNCNGIGLPDAETDAETGQEGAIEHCKLSLDFNGISSADTQEGSQGNQGIEHRRLPVNGDGMGLSDAENGTPEERNEQGKTPVNCNATSLACTKICSKDDGIERGILADKYSGIIIPDTEESSPGDDIYYGKAAMEHKEQKETDAANGFVAIKRKEKPEQASRINKILKPPMGRPKGTLQEIRSITEQNVLGQGRSRRPLADRTNLSEVAATRTPELAGKWKCPRKGKPYVGPPLKQLRLEQWMRRAN